MSAFLQVLNVRFAGRPPARPFRCGRSSQRGRFMPGENIARTAGRATPTFLSAVVDFKLAAATQRVAGPSVAAA